MEWFAANLVSAAMPLPWLDGRGRRERTVAVRCHRADRAGHPHGVRRTGQPRRRSPTTATNSGASATETRYQPGAAPRRPRRCRCAMRTRCGPRRVAAARFVAPPAACRPRWPPAAHRRRLRARADATGSPPRSVPFRVGRGQLACLPPTVPRCVSKRTSSPERRRRASATTRYGTRATFTSDAHRPLLENAPSQVPPPCCCRPGAAGATHPVSRGR